MTQVFAVAAGVAAWLAITWDPVFVAPAIVGAFACLDLILRGARR